MAFFRNYGAYAGPAPKAAAAPVPFRPDMRGALPLTLPLPIPGSAAPSNMAYGGGAPSPGTSVFTQAGSGSSQTMYGGPPPGVPVVNPPLAVTNGGSPSQSVFGPSAPSPAMSAIGRSSSGLPSTSALIPGGAAPAAGKSSLTPLLAGGAAGFLVGGPVGAAVGAGLAYAAGKSAAPKAATNGV